MSSYDVLERHQAMYDNREGADIWFVFGSTRIAAHRCKLEVMKPWFKAMSLPEGDEVDLTHSNIAQNAFEEFLRFAYLRKTILTVDNIAAVTYLAKKSLSKEFLAECENFLMKNLTKDTLCLVYELALVHNIKQLRKVCEDEMCAFAEKIFHSPTFLTIKYVLLEHFLRCDYLVCEERRIFDRCIEWAKSACRRDNQNSTNEHSSERLRAQLKDAIYQIRFSKMTLNEFAECIRSFPGLFSDIELHEIICMIGKRYNYKPKQFNWTQRYYNPIRNNDGFLECKRYTSKTTISYLITGEETTTFTCSQKVLLKSISCEISNENNQPFTLRMSLSIHEKRFEDSVGNVHLYGMKNVRFVYCESIESNEGNFNLDTEILLRPGITYSIKVNLDQYNQIPQHGSHLKLKSRVRVDHDIVFKFKQRGIITALKVVRFHKRNYLRKIVHNPKTWISILVIGISLCALIAIIEVIVQNIDTILNFFKNVLIVILVCFVLYILSRLSKGD